MWLNLQMYIKTDNLNAKTNSKIHLPNEKPVSVRCYFRKRVIDRSILYLFTYFACNRATYPAKMSLNAGLFVGDAQCVSYTSAISRVCFIAVTDMADLDDLIAITHVAGCVVKETLLFFRVHQSE